MLAKRDKDTKRRYLLVVKNVKDSGVLMAGGTGDLKRMVLLDAGVQKMAEAFIKAGDDKPATLFAMCTELLGDKEMTPAAVRHVNELLAATVTKAKADDWKALGKDNMEKMLKLVRTAGAAGSIDSAAGVLLAVSARADNPADLKVMDDTLAEPARKYLAVLTAREKNDKDDPDYYYLGPAGNVIALQGKLKDAKATEMLGKIIEDERWKALRPKAVAAIKEIHGDKADEVLKPFLKASASQPVLPRLRPIPMTE